MPRPISPAMRSYSWHPPYLRGRYVFAVVAVAVAIGGWLALRSEPDLFLRVLPIACVIVAVAALIEHDTRIDADAHAVVRESRLIGTLVVWFWHHPLSEFTEVTTQRESEPGEFHDTVFVGLRRRSGRPMWVSYFHTGVGQPSVEAKLVAQSLADTTGLQLDQDKA
jgi:hypothetical protein